MVPQEEEGIDVVGEASDGAAALDLARRRYPDVVVMDVRMSGMDGIEATMAILAAESRTRILILTTFDLDEYAFGALRLGASGPRLLMITRTLQACGVRGSMSNSG
jgi:DNA-binding NarL/FixJ family response regulator